MKPRPPLPPGPYLVVGRGLSGDAVATLLADHGEVRVVETSAENPGLGHLEGVKTVVKSPGVRPSTALIRTAGDRGLAVMGELEIGWRLLPNEFIAVTGTNGKTTTTELLGAIHRAADIPAAVAGNIGTPVSALVGQIGADVVVVCECSSYQLADAQAFAPECALLLNVEPDHLDWHGGFESYRDAKLRVFANQGAGDVAIVPRGFPEVPGGARRVEYVPDAHAGGSLFGPHNLQNIGAARAVALARGVPETSVDEAIGSFRGVPHRLELVGTVGEVTFFNDSKATNVAATLTALAAFGVPVHLIAGGDDAKGEDFTLLRQAVADRARAVYLIGESAGRLRDALEGTVPLHDSRDLETAVKAASRAAQPGDVVLLSPAAASFDQFKDFEERGDRFRALIANS